MAEIIDFPGSRRSGSIVRATCVQVSQYPQDDGSRLFAVEVLFPDGTWEIVSTSQDIDTVRMLAGKEAKGRNVLLLPDSLWPNRSVRDERQRSDA